MNTLTPREHDLDCQGDQQEISKGMLIQGKCTCGVTRDHAEKKAQEFISGLQAQLDMKMSSAPKLDGLWWFVQGYLTRVEENKPICPHSDLMQYAAGKEGSRELVEAAKAVNERGKEWMRYGGPGADKLLMSALQDLRDVLEAAAKAKAGE